MCPFCTNALSRMIRLDASAATCAFARMSPSVRDAFADVERGPTVFGLAERTADAQCVFRGDVRARPAERPPNLVEPRADRSPVVLDTVARDALHDRDVKLRGRLRPV